MFKDTQFSIDKIRQFLHYSFTLFKLKDYLSDKLGVKVEIITPGALKELTIPTIMRDVIYVE